MLSLQYMVLLFTLNNTWNLRYFCSIRRIMQWWSCALLKDTSSLTDPQTWAVIFVPVLQYVFFSLLILVLTLIKIFLHSYFIVSVVTGHLLTYVYIQLVLRKIRPFDILKLAFHVNCIFEYDLVAPTQWLVLTENKCLVQCHYNIKTKGIKE